MSTINTTQTKTTKRVIRDSADKATRVDAQRILQVIASSSNPAASNESRKMALAIFRKPNGNYLASLTYATDVSDEWAKTKDTVIPNHRGVATPAALLDQMDAVDAIDLSALVPTGIRPGPQDPLQPAVAHVDALWQEVRDDAAKALGIAQVKP